jgi:hypothetical protein
LDTKANTKNVTLGEGDFMRFFFFPNTLLIISKTQQPISFYLLGNQVEQAEDPAPCRPLWIQKGRSTKKACRGKRNEELTDYEQERPATPADKEHDK